MIWKEKEIRKEDVRVSILHLVIYRQIMKSKILYTSGSSPDYGEKRQIERLQSERVSVRKNVEITEETFGGIPVEKITFRNNRNDQIIFYIHGGGIVLGVPKTRRVFTIYLCEKMGYNIAAVDYRLAPESPFPAGANDCFIVYKALLEQYDCKKIIIVGESAGGNLVLSTLLQAKENNTPLPAAVFAIAPTVQFDQKFPSYKENLNADCMVGNLCEEVYDMYLQSREEDVIRNPFAAPYYRDFKGCPPIYLWVSTSEVLRDDSMYFYDKLTKEGQPCMLYFRKNMLHTYLILPFLHESKKDLKVMKEIMDEVMSGASFTGNQKIELK